MSDLDSIGVTFEGDSSSLQNAAKQAADAVEQLGEASSSAMNADTTAPDALATALEDFASRCKNAFADAANMDLSWIADGLGSLSEKSGTVEGLTATLGDFRASLDELVETKREVKDGFAELRREFDDLLRSYKTGNLTIDDTKAKFDELKECFGANVTVLEELQYGNEALYSEVRETASAIEQLDQSSRENAQTQEQVAQALDKAAKAAAQAAQEAAKQAKAEDVTATRMRNAGKSANELREEIIKLGKAKREALSAGETKEADALNTELIETRKQLQELTREANVAKTAILGKAQAGMQAASTLGNLAKSAKDGTLSMADLATGIMSVTMATKAGLGRIGWIMMALQGLKMAWDYLSESEKKATEATQEAKKAMDELNASLLDHAKAVASADISRQMADNKKAMGEMSDAYAEEYRQLDRTIAKQKEKSAAAIEVAEKQRDTQIELAKRRHEQGKFDKDSMQMFIESAEQAYQTVVDNQTAAIEVLQRQRLQAEEANDKIILRKREEFLEGLQHDYGEALTAEWDEMTEYQVQNIVQRSAEIQHDLDVANKRVEVLQAQIAAEKDKDKKKELEEQLEEVQKLVNYKANELTSLADQADRICKDFKDGAKQVSKNFNLTGIDLAKFSLAVHTQTEAARKEVQAATVKAARSAEAVKDFDESKALREETAAKEREIAEKAAKETDAYDEAIREKEKQVEKEKELTGQITELTKKHKTYRSYSDKQTLTQQQIYEADKATLEAKLEELRALKEEQWLDGSLLYGTPEQQKIIDDAIAAVEGQLRGLAAEVDKFNTQEASKQASESLSEIGKTYKLIGNYTRKEALTQDQIYQQDLQALTAKKAALRAMLGDSSIDDKTRKKITAALEEAEQQSRGLAQAMAENAKQARSFLKEMDPPQFDGKGTSRTIQKTLDRLAKGYQRAAQRAERAAARGDEKGMERAMRSMNNYARAMGRLAQKPSEVAKFHEETTAKARLAASASDKTAKASEQSARAEARNAAATNRKAAANERAAKEAEQDTQQAQHANDKLIALDSKVDGIKTALNDLAKSTAKLNSNMGQLAPLIGQVTQLVRECASATASAVRGIKGELASIQQQINRINAKL